MTSPMGSAPRMRSSSVGKAARRSSNEPRVEVSIAMPTWFGDTGVTYASASGAQCTSTYDVHGATRKWRRKP
jgi:hypothetical protein